MKIAKKSIIIFALIFFVINIFAFSQGIATVNADEDLWKKQQGLGTGDEAVAEAFGGGTPKDPRTIAAYVIKIILGFMGIIFLVLLILAGFKWMTARGNEEQVTEAKSQISNAVIGLIIVASAYAIASYITDCVLDITTGGTIWMCK